MSVLDIRDPDGSVARYQEWQKRKREMEAAAARDDYTQRLYDRAPDMLETLRCLLEGGDLTPEDESMVRDTVAPFMEDWS